MILLPDWSNRKIITGVLVVVFVLGAFFLLFHFLPEFLLVFTGIVISISISPPIDWLVRHKLSRSFSVVLLYLILAGVFAGFIFLVIPQTAQEATTIVPKVESIYSEGRSSLQDSPLLIIRQVAGVFPASLNSFFTANPPAADGEAADPLNGTLTILQTILDALFKLGVVLLIGFYWTLEGEKVEYAFSLLLPVDKRETTRDLIHEMEARVSGFMRGQGLLGFAVGAASLVAYLIIGLPSAIPLAFFAGLLEMVPFFGPTLGAIPAAVVAFAISPTKLVWVVLATVVVQFLENHFLSPRVMKKTVGVNPIVTILSITGFGFLFGFLGLVMAIPLAAVFQVILERTLLRPEGLAIPAPAGRDRLSKLSYDTREFTQDIRKRIRKKEAGDTDGAKDEIEDTIEAIAIDLDGLISQTIQEDKPL
ncbi:MAG TPA: AI-2E family transporter [Anaerolinea sp.]|nr:AI-2E family transporter [Anaerolinea sp.]